MGQAAHLDGCTQQRLDHQHVARATSALLRQGSLPRQRRNQQQWGACQLRRSCLQCMDLDAGSWTALGAVQKESALSGRPLPVHKAQPLPYALEKLPRNAKVFCAWCNASKLVTQSRPVCPVIKPL